jgi:hypothetical protein
MRIRLSQLRRIIKEEVQRTLREGDTDPWDGFFEEVKKATTFEKSILPENGKDFKEELSDYLNRKRKYDTAAISNALELEFGLPPCDADPNAAIEDHPTWKLAKKIESQYG